MQGEREWHDRDAGASAEAQIPGRAGERLVIQMRGRRIVPLVGLAGVLVAGTVLYNSSDEMFAAIEMLTRLDWSWVAPALVAEAVSYLARGRAQALVLRSATASTSTTSNGHTPGVVVLSATTLAADAAAHCLPLGFAAGGVVTVGALHRRGVEPAVASWLFAVSTALYVGAGSMLTLVALQVAGIDSPVPRLQQLSAGVLITVGAFSAVVMVLRRTRTTTLDRLIGSGRLARWLTPLRAIRLPLGSGAAALALMTCSWLCEAAVLAISHAAVGTAPPWTGLVLAYCAGQAAAGLPLTPGGIGAVEGSVTVTLVAFGGELPGTLAAVLLYRLITYWACIPLGGLTWLILHRSRTDQETPGNHVARA